MRTPRPVPQQRRPGDADPQTPVSVRDEPQNGSDGRLARHASAAAGGTPCRRSARGPSRRRSTGTRRASARWHRRDHRETPARCSIRRATYCDTSRVGIHGVRAGTRRAAATTASSRAERGRFARGLREVLELLNDDLGSVLQRNGRVAEDIEVDADRFGSRGGHSGGENVLRDDPRGASCRARR